MATEFLYHAKPNELRSLRLYPLHQLKNVDEKLFEQASKKYEGREHLMDVLIPSLRCRWNDVVHLSPIHPKIIRNEIEQLGGQVNSDTKWLKIPVNALSGLDAVYFSHAPSRAGDTYDFPASAFKPFDISVYKELGSVPRWTSQWYREEIESHRRPLLFNGVPHVLVKGEIPIHEAQEITW